VLDEGIADRLQGKIAKPVIAFPDFTDESAPDINFEIAQKIRAKAAGRKIVGLLGSLDKRKGTLTLLEVSQQVSDRWFFVFAGRLAEPAFTAAELAKIGEIVKANPENCFFHLTRIPTEAQFNAIIQICDLLYAAYENFFPSVNVLIKAAIFEKPVIASKNYCMGERVEKFNLGYGIEGGSVSQCVSILEQLHEELSTGHLSIQPDFEGYRHLHSIDQLSSAFQKILEFV
jgi:glycosyltransferase involved in cell wall biosynthesis